MVAPPGGRAGERQAAKGRDRAEKDRLGKSQGGMSPALMNSKYPGMQGKKVKQYELSAENVAKVGTIAAGMLGGPVGSSIAAGSTALDAALNGTNPISGALNPFSGYQGEVPAGPAGFAQGKDTDKMLDPATKLAMDRNKAKNKKQNLSKGFTLLAGAGGTLLGS